MKTLLLCAAAAAVLVTAAAAQHHDHHAMPAVQAGPQPRATEAQLATVRAAVARYADFEVARREGWKKFGGDGPLMGEHYSLPPEKGGIDYVSGMPLDFRRPSNLMYTFVNGKRVLTGVAFNVRIAPGEPVPEGFAGSADVWHVHDFPKAVAAALQDRPLLRWVADRFGPQHFVGKGDGRGRLAMVHVWTGPIPNPDGPFAHRNRAIPYAKLGLPFAFAEGASEHAARGLQLAAPNGCAETIDGALWVANAGAHKARLHAACKAAADHVRIGLKSGTKVQVNTMAEHGWAMFDAQWKRALTPAQQARIAAITEHGPSDAAPGHPHHQH
ncbi:hypothetical protein [Sphingomonas mesophila]|uniref:hypothetical protein n=1 Tax=Sphingomonas mesophila TaxID=2303576 RepID=UPI000E5874AD|nr:hypothetical protein [Sphingomonas mesophila]